MPRRPGVPLSDSHRMNISAALRARSVGEEPKQCPDCREVKTREHFRRRSNGYSGSLCQACDRLKSRRYRQAHPDRVRAQNRRTSLWRYFGLRPDDFDEMLARQAGRCAICACLVETSAGRERLSVDHCHDTGRVRGLLCATCNKGLGVFGDDLDRLRAAVAYLESPPLLEPARYAIPGMPSGWGKVHERCSHAALASA